MGKNTRIFLILFGNFNETKTCFLFDKKRKV